MGKGLNSHLICTALILYTLLLVTIVTAFQNEGTREAAPNEFPSYATLVKSNFCTSLRGIICSGTLVTGVFVLTTANCISKNRITDTRIMLGKGKVGTLERLDCDLRSIEWWESYSEWASRNNRLVDPQPRFEIAMIRLLKRVVFNANVGPALVPFDMVFPETERMSVSLIGWTITGEGYVLKTAAVAMQPPSSFQAIPMTYYVDRAVKGNLLIVETELKLGSLDEGGPLLYNGNTLMGLNYWSGRKCEHRKREFLIKSTYYEDFLRFYLFGHE